MAAIANDRTHARWPGFPAAATIAEKRLGHGSAMTARDATLGAVGEIVEIASCCAWADEGLTRMPLAEASRQGAWPPDMLNGFSSAQLAVQSAENQRLAGTDWAPGAAPGADQAIDWIEAWDPCNDHPVLVPADFALIGRRDAGDADALAVADTNGCAAGKTAAAARMSAIFELVERDATARWWYGGRTARRLRPPDGDIPAVVGAFLSADARSLRLFDITTDIGIPTVAALSCDAAGGAPALGFATRSTMTSAITAAMEEMMMMMMRIKAAAAQPGTDDDIERWFADASDAVITDAASDDPPTPDAGPGAVDLCLRSLQSAGVRIAFLDRTRPELGIPAVRALSPDLCHWKPRFGFRRHPARDLTSADAHPLLRI